MSQRKLVDIIEFVITVEGELLGRWKNIAKYHQANLDSERLDYSDKENHCKTKKKYTKIQFDTIKKSVIAITIIMKDTLQKNVNF